ncbi:MAG: hypothetical protein ACTHKG_07230, partial [Nocardioides sp.]
MRMPPTVRALTAAGPLRRVLAAYLLFALVEMSIWLAILLWAYDEGGARLAGLGAGVHLRPAAGNAPPPPGHGAPFNPRT